MGYFGNLKAYFLMVLDFWEMEMDIFLLSSIKIIHHYFRNNLANVFLCYFCIFVNF